MKLRTNVTHLSTSNLLTNKILLVKNQLPKLSSESNQRIKIQTYSQFCFSSMVIVVPGKFLEDSSEATNSMATCLGRAYASRGLCGGALSPLWQWSATLALRLPQPMFSNNNRGQIWSDFMAASLGGVWIWWGGASGPDMELRSMSSDHGRHCAKTWRRDEEMHDMKGRGTPVSDQRLELRDSVTGGAEFGGVAMVAHWRVNH